MLVVVQAAVPVEARTMVVPFYLDGPSGKGGSRKAARREVPGMLRVTVQGVVINQATECLRPLLAGGVTSGTAVTGSEIQPAGEVEAEPGRERAEVPVMELRRPRGGEGSDRCGSRTERDKSVRCVLQPVRDSQPEQGGDA